MESPDAQPWCFWFGSRNPHRGYRKGSGVASGMDPLKVCVPAIFADTSEVCSDICDYFFETHRFDKQIGEILKLIEEVEQLDNTLVGMLTSLKSGIVESDRDAVITGRERHAWCRSDGMDYPSRKRI